MGSLGGRFGAVEGLDRVREGMSSDMKANAADVRIRDVVDALVEFHRPLAQCLPISKTKPFVETTLTFGFHSDMGFVIGSCRFSVASNWFATAIRINNKTKPFVETTVSLATLWIANIAK